MPDRDVVTIRDLVYYQYATIIAKSAFAASDGREGYRLTHRDDKRFYDSIPPLLEKKYLKTIYHCHSCSGTLAKGHLDGDEMVTVLDMDAVIR
jgi:hypothetical protein